jgi:hypothetical protein
VGWYVVGVGEKYWRVGGLGDHEKEAARAWLACGIAAAGSGRVSGDAFDGGKFRCDVFAGDFGVVVGLHVDPEHFAQP